MPFGFNPAARAFGIKLCFKKAWALEKAVLRQAFIKCAKGIRLVTEKYTGNTKKEDFVY
jgi:hypothetical protein